MESSPTANHEGPEFSAERSESLDPSVVAERIDEMSHDLAIVETIPGDATGRKRFTADYKDHLASRSLDEKETALQKGLELMLDEYNQDPDYYDSRLRSHALKPSEIEAEERSDSLRKIEASLGIPDSLGPRRR